MKTQTIELYTIDELSEDSIKKAHENYINHGLGYEPDFLLEDFERILFAIGFYDIKIYYSGFYSQGDGACITGKYCYSKGWSKDLKGYLVGEGLKEWQSIGQSLMALQAPKFYDIRAEVVHRGHYYHENSMSANIEDSDRIKYYCKVEEDFKSILVDISKAIYKALESEYGYTCSLEYFIETAQANEWYFNQVGEFV